MDELPTFTTARGRAGQVRPWLLWEIEFLRLHYADSLTSDLAEAIGRPVDRVLAKANYLGLRKFRETIAALARERTQRPGHGIHAYRLQAGHVPWNKGRKGMPALSPQTVFKKGHRPSKWVPVGTFRVSPDGILEQKYSDNPGPPGARWRRYALLLWEAEHGPLPTGHIVVFKPGMRTLDPAQITLDKLECISRAENIRRNRIHNLPPEFAEVARLKAALTKAINTRQRKEGREAEGTT